MKLPVMKKIKDIEKYGKYQRQRTYRELKGRQHYKLWRVTRNRLEQGISKSDLKVKHNEEHLMWKYSTIDAPANLSFIKNTEEVIRAC